MKHLQIDQCIVEELMISSVMIFVKYVTRILEKETKTKFATKQKIT